MLSKVWLKNPVKRYASYDFKFNLTALLPTLF